MPQEIIKRLSQLKDSEYRDFHSRLMPGFNKDRILGVRIPHIRRLATELIKEEGTEDFLSTLPHYYYEENNLHAFIICKSKDIDVLLAELDRFLPYVDNWATCDSIRSSILAKNTHKLLPYIEKWIESNHEYTVRFAIEMLMVYYLDENFSDAYVRRVAEIKSDRYYINMMIAWYFATALAKRWKDVIYVLEDKMLTPDVHNKTIRKAKESYRITKEQKKYLEGIKITEKKG